MAIEGSLLSVPPKTARAAWPEFVGVDEGLEMLFRWTPENDRMVWAVPLANKCRTLQLISATHLLGVTDQGYFEARLGDGKIVRQASLEQAGVIAAARVGDGHTMLTGIDLAGLTGVTFAEYDSADRLHRTVFFPGDYVRGATLTAGDTILFTNNDRVLEGDWSGRILREFSAPGFKHAWKAQRLPNGHTLISAGYGAFIAEFDQRCREIRRWVCAEADAAVRPFFFGDFNLRPDGSLVVCNWLGHGTGLGGTGYALLQFNPAGAIVKVWQDAERTSSVQAFALLDHPVEA